VLALTDDAHDANNARPTLETTVSEVMRAWPETVEVFIHHRMACVGCAMAPFCTVGEAALAYQIDQQAFLRELEQAPAVTTPATTHHRRPEMTPEPSDLSDIQSDAVVDARGSACPGPLLEAKKGIGNVSVGGVLEVWSGSNETADNLARWCKKTGNEYLGFVDEGAYVRVFVRRQK